jgi:hypothetical protein
MTETDALALMHYLRAKGYVAHAEFFEVNGTWRWTVVATRRGAA